MSDDADRGGSSDQLLEIYKMYAEFADRASQRRLAAASGYLPLLLNVIVVISALALQSSNNTVLGKPGLTLAPVLGLFVSVAWLQDERRWHVLQAAKFEVLNEMGRLLPYDPFDAEWRAVRKRDFRRYWPMFRISLPWIFVLANVVTAVLVWVG